MVLEVDTELARSRPNRNISYGSDLALNFMQKPHGLGLGLRIYLTLMIRTPSETLANCWMLLLLSDIIKQFQQQFRGWIFNRVIYNNFFLLTVAQAPLQKGKQPLYRSLTK